MMKVGNWFLTKGGFYKLALSLCVLCNLFPFPCVLWHVLASFFWSFGSKCLTLCRIKGIYTPNLRQNEQYIYSGATKII